LIGANLVASILLETKMAEATLVATTTVDFPSDLAYRDFFTFLYRQGCLQGTFLVVEDGQVRPVEVDISADLAQKFFFRGEWRNARMYVCGANMREAILQSWEIGAISMAGVDLRGADLRFADLSQAILSQVIQVDGIPYTLQANLEGVNWNDFTQWPAGFQPPPRPVETPNP
jgi:hypothetical protein